MAERRVDEAARAFLRTLGGHDKLAGDDKLAVELSGPARGALGVDAAPEGLDELEAAATTSSDPHPLAEATDAAAADLPASIAANREVADLDETSDADAPDAGEPSAASSTASAEAMSRGLFSARRAHPMVLHDQLQARYGDDWLFWEPETLWWAIRRDFGPLSDLCRNKIQALRLAVTSYAPWSDWDTFENCGVAWNDGIPIFGAFQPLTPSELAFACQLLQELHPEAPLGHEVIAYQAAILDETGFVYAPESWFPGAQRLLDRKSTDSAFRAAVENAWTEVQDKNLTAVQWRADNPVDIHIGRLLVVRTYLQERAALRSASTQSASRPTERGPLTPSVPA